MFWRLKAGIIVNNETETYDIVRDDNGALIESVPFHLRESKIQKAMHYIREVNRLWIVNETNLYYCLSQGFHPVLSWRPGQTWSERRKGTSWELDNIRHTRHQRKTGRLLR